MILKRNSYGSYPFLPDLKENPSNIPSLIIMFALFFNIQLNQVMEVSLHFSFTKSFYHKQYLLTFIGYKPGVRHCSKHLTTMLYAYNKSLRLLSLFHHE